MLSWNKQQKGSYITEIGDLRVILKEYPNHWWLSIGIRSYSKDRSKSMVRPPANIFQFEKPCTDEQAIARANEYMDNFIKAIVADFS